MEDGLLFGTSSMLEAVCLDHTNRHKEALEMYKTCGKIRQRLLPRGHKDYLEYLNNVSICLCGLGNDELAEKLLKKCIGIQRSQLGDRHPDLARSLLLMAPIQRRKSKFVVAIKMLE